MTLNYQHSKRLIFQTTKEIQSLFDSIIPKGKNILTHKVSSMDRTPGVTHYNEPYSFQPSELAPLQRWSMPITLGETDTESEMESSHWQPCFPLEQPVDWMGWGHLEKRTGRCDLKSDFSMNQGPELPWHLGCLQNQQKIAWMDFYSKKFDHRMCFCLFLG